MYWGCSMATISENLQALNEEKELQKIALENKGQDMTDVPYTQYHEKIADIQTKEDLDTELNEQETLLASLESSVDELPEKPYDMLQARIDSDNSCQYLFYNYLGDNVDFAKNLDTSNVTNMSYMFDKCGSLTTIPQLDTNKVTNLAYMFRDCSNLHTIPQLDTSSAINMHYMFYGCSNLTVLPELKTSNAKIMIYMFSGCDKLTTVLFLDMRSATNVTSIFAGCKALTNLTIKNVKISLQIGSGTSWGHLLTDESIVNTFQELWDLTGSSTQTLTLSTPSNARTGAIYVKLVEVTDDMRAQDEYIDNKKPCVVCESSDDGAMTLKEYGISKNWNIA